MFVEEFSEKPESTEEQSAAERRKNEHVVERSVAAPSPFSSAHRAKPTSEQVEDNVEHLILVVHGIGKALQAFDLLGLVQLKSIVDCCKWMRDNHEEVRKNLRGAKRRVKLYDTGSRSDDLLRSSFSPSSFSRSPPLTRSLWRLPRRS